MSQDRLPPPEVEACLVLLRSSSQKGGTLVAEDVAELAAHEARVGDPDGYRPRFCPRCLGTRLHVHDYRRRILLADPVQRATSVVRHQCVGCEAIWQTLPAFIARHLWRTWRVVERTLTGATSMAREVAGRRWRKVPGRTRRRWRTRWLRPARFLSQVLATSGETAWATLAGALRPGSRCMHLVASFGAAHPTPSGELLAAVAALVYRLQPKVRLM